VTLMFNKYFEIFILPLLYLYPTSHPSLLSLPPRHLPPSLPSSLSLLIHVLPLFLFLSLPSRSLSFPPISLLFSLSLPCRYRQSLCGRHCDEQDEQQVTHYTQVQHTHTVTYTHSGTHTVTLHIQWHSYTVTYTHTHTDMHTYGRTQIQ
jgi:hypothetical protein